MTVTLQQAIANTKSFSKWTWGGIATLCVLLLLWLFPPILFYVNTTASATEGIYIYNPLPLSIGDYAVIRSPVEIPEVGLDMNHLLLKRKMGEVNDRFSIQNGELILIDNHSIDEVIDGRDAFFPIRQDFHYFHLKDGSYTVPKGYTLFLNPTPDSFDSRYLGPIPNENIVAHVSLLISFAQIRDFQLWVNNILF